MNGQILCGVGAPAVRLALSLALLAAATPTVAGDTTTLEPGARRPTLDFALLDGTAGPSWDALAGRVVVVDFWASWCAPCIGEFPHLNDLKEQFAERNVAFFSVTYETGQTIGPLLAERPLETAIGIDNDFATFRSFAAWGIPATYVFDRNGVLAAALHPASLTPEVLETVLAGNRPNVEQHPGWPDPAGAETYFRSLLNEARLAEAPHDPE